VDITSIKRKKATLDSMANVLNEFLSGVSKGFADAAFASFSRRRSTVRDDINQTFGSAPVESDKVRPAQTPGGAYLDMLNNDGGAISTTTALPALKAKPAAQSAARPAAKPAARPAARPAAKPAAKPSANASRNKGGKEALKEL
jgi:hypothetical protein